MIQWLLKESSLQAHRNIVFTSNLLIKQPILVKPWKKMKFKKLSSIVPSNPEQVDLQAHFYSALDASFTNCFQFLPSFSTLFRVLLQRQWLTIKNPIYAIKHSRETALHRNAETLHTSCAHPKLC